MQFFIKASDEPLLVVQLTAAAEGKPSLHLSFCSVATFSFTHKETAEHRQKPLFQTEPFLLPQESSSRSISPPCTTATSQHLLPRWCQRWRPSVGKAPNPCPIAAWPWRRRVAQTSSALPRGHLLTTVRTVPSIFITGFSVAGFTDPPLFLQQTSTTLGWLRPFSPTSSSSFGSFPLASCPRTALETGRSRTST